MLYFTPGPSALYPTVRKHIIEALDAGIPSLSHRSDAYQDVAMESVEAVRNLLQLPDDYSVFFMSSATEVMERVLQNSVGRYSGHLINGAFSSRLAEFAELLGLTVVTHDVPMGEGYTQLPSFDDSVELITVVHNETSTGVMTPVDYIYDLAAAYPESLIVVDIVSSIPVVELDFTKIDIGYFSVQKGLGLPSGLAVVVLSPRAIEAEQRVTIKRGTYRRWSALKKYADKYQTQETPNILNIYLLGKVLADMEAKGWQTIRDETIKKAIGLYDYFARDERFDLEVSDVAVRSLTTAHVGVKGEVDRLHQGLREKGIVVGRGYGPYSDTHIRVANFPAHSVEDMDYLLETFESISW